MPGADVLELFRNLSPSDEGWHHECRRALIVTMLIVLSSAILGSPVLAHSAAEMGIAPD